MVTEIQPAVGRSVRRKRKFAVMGQNFGEVFLTFPAFAGISLPKGQTYNIYCLPFPRHNILCVQRKGFSYKICSL